MGITRLVDRKVNNILYYGCLFCVNYIEKINYGYKCLGFEKYLKQ